MSATRQVPGGWWIRRTGQRDPVVYVADVDRLRRDASALLAACEMGADLLMCDRDNDDPCTEYPEGEHPDETETGNDRGDCNPCAVRRLLWAAAAKARGTP